MNEVYIEEKTFDTVDFTKNELQRGEYENCLFKTCNFSNIDLSNFKFLECEFTGCNLSMAKLTETAFREVKFTDCKMLGLHFDDCAPIGLSIGFDNCNLTHSSFYQTKMKGTVFKSCLLHEVDFVETDLSNCLFDYCDFIKAVFGNSILEKTDFRSSYNYAIDPEINRVKKAKFSLSGIAGLLNKYDIEIDFT